MTDVVKTESATGTPEIGRRGKLAWWLAAAAVVLLGFGLRYAYYWEGYSHPDEAITVEVCPAKGPVHLLLEIYFFQVPINLAETIK